MAHTGSDRRLARLAGAVRPVRALHELLELLQPHLRLAGRGDHPRALALLLGLDDPVRRRVELAARPSLADAEAPVQALVGVGAVRPATRTKCDVPHGGALGLHA